MFSFDIKKIINDNLYIYKYKYFFVCLLRYAPKIITYVKFTHTHTKYINQ